MRKSRYGLALIVAGWGMAAEAEPPAAGLLTADEAMKHYHETYGIHARASAAAACPQRGSGADEEIVVCGRTPTRAYRLPLPIEREPGEGGRAGPDSCSRNCYQPVKIDLIGAARVAPKVIRHLLHPGDD
jgi:hypothetical protein